MKAFTIIVLALVGIALGLTIIGGIGFYVISFTNLSSQNLDKRITAIEEFLEDKTDSIIMRITPSIDSSVWYEEVPGNSTYPLYRARKVKYILRIDTIWRHKPIGG